MTTQTKMQAQKNLQQYKDKIIVVKLGGHSMSQEGMEAVGSQVAILHQAGAKVVVVHGGGPLIDAEMKKAELVPQMHESGKRVTTPQVISCVQAAFMKLGKALTEQISQHTENAEHIWGWDAFMAERHMPNGDDIGMVGKPVGLKETENKLVSALDKGIIPVISPLTINADKCLLNVNADEAAAGLSGALGAKRCFFLTNVPGVKNAGGTVEKILSPEKIADMVEAGIISGGMIPKVESALLAVQQGAEASVILPADNPEALIQEVVQPSGIGTLIAELHTIKKLSGKAETIRETTGNPMPSQLTIFELGSR